MKLKGGKVKLSLDLTKLSEFFVQHVEKVVLAILGLVFVWFTYSAVKTERYQRVPQDLKTATESAQQRYTTSTWDEEDIEREQIAVADYANKAKQAANAIDAENYRPRQNWTALLFPHEQKRRAPAYLPVEELRAVGGFGAFRAKNRADPPIGRPWAVVTGAIPFGNQRAEFVRALGGVDATGELDPKYVAVALLREEVIGEATQVEKINGIRILAKDVDDVMKQCTVGEEILNPMFIIALDSKDNAMNELCNALPAFVGNRKWDSSVGHPKFPMPLPSATNDSSQSEDPKQPVEPTEPVAEQPKEAPTSDPNSPFGEEDVKPEAKPEAAAKEDAAATVVADNGYRLFRFFDFTVQPGKRYRYQVILRLINPNHGVDAKLLEDPALALKPHGDTPYSNITDFVSIPRGTELLAGPAKPGRSTTEAVAKVLLRQWSNKGGGEATQEVELLKGQVANFVALAAMLHKSDGKPEETTGEDFTTDTMLVDVSGGERISVLGKQETRPSEVLLLDPDGRLVVRSEMEDLPTYRSFMLSEEETIESDALGGKKSGTESNKR